MSIFAAIRDRIILPLFDTGYTKATFRIDRQVAVHLIPIIKRLAPGDYEAWVQLDTIRPFFFDERPLLEIFNGKQVCVHIEGPLYTCGGMDFPLGGQLMADKFGWLNIGPGETRELLLRIRKAIDEATFAWASENDLGGEGRSPRVVRNRPVDDELALRQMADAAAKILLEGEAVDARPS